MLSLACVHGLVVRSVYFYAIVNGTLSSCIARMCPEGGIAIQM